MRKTAVAFFGLLVVGSMMTSAAIALPEFKKEFEKKYVAPAKDSQFSQLTKDAARNVCHVKDQKKDVRNAYGEALAKLVQGDAKKRLKKAEQAGGSDAKDAEMKKLLDEINDAMIKAEGEKSPSGSTFGELLKTHKLPAQ
jgi:hypothetical protein